MPAQPPFRLDPDLARFMMGGVSINAGSSRAGRPALCRALGCRVARDGRQVTVFFAGPQAAELLDGVGPAGSLAVVFSDPPTHRTLQVKGSDARLAPLARGDAARVAAYRAAFVQCLLPLGFKEPLIRALLDCPDQDLVALTFTAEAAFNQTPGAQAGAPLLHAPAPASAEAP